MKQTSVDTPRAGSMTAVMRAALPAAPRVLRIGLVEGGKIIEERIVDRRTAVTIGSNERCTFVLAGKSVPSTHRLFEAVGGVVCLNVIDGMTGRVSLGSGAADLETLKHAGKAIRSGDHVMHQVQLGEGARGKIAIGDTAFLFQFVAPPPRPSKPRLPLAVVSSLSSDMDWTTTVIAGFSFLLHFGAAGAIYADWLDPLVGDEFEVAQLVETMKQFAAPPVEQVQTAGTSAGATARATDATKSSGRGERRDASTNKGGERGPMSNARATALAGELASLDLRMIAVLSATGHDAQRVLDGGEVPMELLDRVPDNGAGVGHGDIPGLDMGGPGSGAVRPGTGGRDLRSIGDGQAKGVASSGVEVHVAPPPGRALLGEPLPTGGSVTDAGAVVAGMAAGFRRCYNNGLNQGDPNMRGSIRITTKIAPNGDVQSAVPSGGGTLSGGVIGCVVSRVASAHFSPPTGGGATLVIPVTFEKQ